MRQISGFEYGIGGDRLSENHNPSYPETGIDQIKDLIVDHYPGNCVPVHRVHFDAVIVSNRTPVFRSVWSVFGDINGMGGLAGPMRF